ncbi:PLP-dependent aminotransferase family protein [Paenibacillus validus]|uniref:Aminotransferase class I/II-fold pyridoxal phosphate-dependent enzyme n=1 Tax=Paenibacillus validus TaxID=44253 RepID=A0A7X2ZES7_9BACL|nr:MULTISPECIES: PLP-dependent aminotransferase family protein [Paenibacillus]MED4602962.1 PLP-dependent aminotransferase family protein [Paenibacillus validus]MED4608477.1 PLP-dependent aminotransferase family protein [Paenibacillus validus]MUG73562.1 aminotransferase class I/II-fold pyridoxal phosphate-dependent enzyme [Paenibacillus validus]
MNYRFSETIDSFKSSAVREILKLTQGRSIISLAGGLPNEQYFPLDAVRDAFARVFEQGNSVLQYGLTEGFTPLRESISKHLARKGIHAGIDNMLLTTGSQQAIDLLTKIYVDPGDVILVEKPTYLAAIQVFQSHKARLVSVDCDTDGMNPEDLERKIKLHQPKFVYVIPTFANPTGKAWSIERRQHTLDICKRNNVLILEDDPYGELRFGKGEPLPSIFSLGGEADGNPVIYTSTFSKIVAPALRTGWVVGDKEVIRHMARAKQAADLHSSTMDQQAIHQIFESFDIYGHIDLIRTQYEIRMHQMIDLLKAQNWEGVKWVEPKGGMFIWVEMPQHIDTAELMKFAVEEGVAFVPGVSFYADEPQTNSMRLNFTHTDYEEMKTAFERLNRAIEKLQSVAVQP